MARTIFVKQLEEGFRYITRHAWLRVSILYLAFLNAAVISPLMVLGPTVARDRVGGAVSWAEILTGTVVGGIVGAASGLKLRPRRPLVGALAVVLAAIPFAALLAIGAPVWIIVAVAFLFGAQSSVSNILITSLIQ